jgi:hypothetical protein
MNIVSRAVIGASLLFAANTWAMDIQGSHSGSWYNADQSGHGLSIEVLDEENLAAYWFTYTPDGEPIFLVTLADIDGDTAHGTLHQYSGMRFGEFDTRTLSEETWGALSITFTSCDTATITYQSTATHLGVSYGSGQFDLVRLTSVDGLDCIEPQSLGKYGNYTANVMDGGVDIGDAEIMILKNGAMAYHFSISDVYYESGFGQLTMGSDTEFDYETSVEYYGTYREQFSDKFIFRGNGNYSGNGVSLDVPYDLSLNGVVDPAVYAGITMQQLAGTYEGNLPGDMMPRVSLHIAEDGSITGLFGPFLDNPVTGKVTIPDPGMNQFQLEFQSAWEGSWSLWNASIGSIRADEIYLIARQEMKISDVDHLGIFDWTLEKQ